MGYIHAGRGRPSDVHAGVSKASALTLLLRSGVPATCYRGIILAVQNLPDVVVRDLNRTIVLYMQITTDSIC